MLENITHNIFQTALTWLLGQHNRREPWHDGRYALTLELAAKYTDILVDDKKLNVLDVGGESIFTVMLRALTHQQISCTGQAELRSVSELFNSTQYPAPFDVIFCNEVIKHIHDLPSSNPTERERWTGSGQLKLLRNMRDMMHMQSRLILTTPNACGQRPLMKWLAGQQPMFFDAHVRELTVPTVIQLAAFAGLRPVAQAGWHTWETVASIPTAIGEFLRKSGIDMEQRYDDLWFVFEKA